MDDQNTDRASSSSSPSSSSSSSLEIAPLRDADVPSVLDLIADVYREYGMTLNLEDPAEQHLADPGTYFRSHDGEYWVVRDDQDDDAIVATVAMLVTAPGVAELKSLYVRPDCRRRGFGRHLTQQVIDAAKAQGCSMLVLWSDTRFDGAHALYESMGFTRVGQRDIEDSNASTEYGFTLALSDDDPRSALLRGGD